MDPDDSIFSHQVDIAKRLSVKFNEILILTNKVPSQTFAENTLVNLNWIQGQNFRNIIKFYLVVIRYWKFIRNSIIFSHMTEVQSALLSPITKFLNIQHYLWYAHAAKSRFLNWNYFFTNGIITSTSGSCPKTGNKIHYIGQSIDFEIFDFKERDFSKIREFVYFGRIDPSKKIHEIIECLSRVRETSKEINLRIVGSNSGKQTLNYYEGVRDYVNEHCRDWVTFEPSVNRKYLPETLQDAQVFIHSFQGSLDKTLLEATSLGLAVVTINKEYTKEFGSWGSSFNQISLHSEIIALLQLDNELIRQELKSRLVKVRLNHSIENWIKSTSDILLAKSQPLNM